MSASSWVIIPDVYEKWVHPGSKDKHYRAIFRNGEGGRRLSKIKFKRATDALDYARRYVLHLCPKKEGDHAV